MTILSLSSLAWLTGNLNPAHPTSLIPSQLQTCSISRVSVSGLWHGHWLLPIIPLETRDHSLSLTPKSNASPRPTKLTFYIFLKSVHLSHPVIIFLSQAPSGLAWHGLVLIQFLSSPLPSLQSFLHTNLGWHFQNAHTTNCSSSQLQLWFQDFSACHWPQDKDQNKAPKTLTLLLHPPSSLGTFSLTF